MKIGICTDRIEDSYTYMKSGEIFFSPLFEMFAAMHVICNPEHHTARLHWWERVKEIVDEQLISDIRELSECTNQWFAPMDFVTFDTYPVRDMNIEEALTTLEGYSINTWKKVFSDNDTNVTPTQKQKIINVSRRLYESYFYQEIMILEPLMNTALKKMLKAWETEGIAKSLSDIHERLKVNESGIVFVKNREFHFKYDEINKIFVTGSVFLSPHLIMGRDNNSSIQTVKHFYAENVQTCPPEELVRLYNGLADGTRLQILRIIKHRPDTTQNLAIKLGISEAAVSKQLKVLSAGGLVTKQRKGNYMYYSVAEEALDFLTYRIYEYLM